MAGGGLYSTNDRSALISGCSAGKVLSFPVLGSLSVSWSSSRGNAGILVACSCPQQTKAAQDALYKVSQAKAEQKRPQPCCNTLTLAGNTFMPRNLYPTKMPNPEGTPRSHLHMSQRKSGVWCRTLIPVPYRKATDIFQDNKMHVGTLCNMEIRYLNQVAEELC